MNIVTLISFQHNKQLSMIVYIWGTYWFIRHHMHHNSGYSKVNTINVSIEHLIIDKVEILLPLWWTGVRFISCKQNIFGYWNWIKPLSQDRVLTLSVPSFKLRCEDVLTKNQDNFVISRCCPERISAYWIEIPPFLLWVII